MQSRIASHEALVLTQRVIGLYCPCAGCPLTPVRRLKTNELWAAESVFLRVGIGLKSTSRLRMARRHRDRGPMALLPLGVEENPQDR